MGLCDCVELQVLLARDPAVECYPALDPLRTLENLRWIAHRLQEGDPGKVSAIVIADRAGDNEVRSLVRATMR